MTTLLFILWALLGSVIGLLILFLMGGIYREFTIAVIDEIKKAWTKKQ